MGYVNNNISMQIKLGNDLFNNQIPSNLPAKVNRYRTHMILDLFPTSFLNSFYSPSLTLHSPKNKQVATHPLDSLYITLPDQSTILSHSLTHITKKIHNIRLLRGICSPFSKDTVFLDLFSTSFLNSFHSPSLTLHSPKNKQVATPC